MRRTANARTLLLMQDKLVDVQLIKEAFRDTGSNSQYFHSIDTFR